MEFSQAPDLRLPERALGLRTRGTLCTYAFQFIQKFIGPALGEVAQQPRHVHAIMCFAGLWESWTPPGQPDAATPPAPLHTFTILTTTPNPFAARWHDRMPVILPERSWDAWLSPDAKREALEPLLTPYGAYDLVAWAVTPRMNTPRFESPECVEPITEGATDLKLE